MKKTILKRFFFIGKKTSYKFLIFFYPICGVVGQTWRKPPDVLAVGLGLVAEAPRGS
jgi:hypothetical protein